jgi:hypothetical protein
MIGVTYLKERIIKNASLKRDFLRSNFTVTKETLPEIRRPPKISMSDKPISTQILVPLRTTSGSVTSRRYPVRSASIGELVSL